MKETLADEAAEALAALALEEKREGRDLVKVGGTFHRRQPTKNLPQGTAVLALIDGETISVRVLGEAERAALKPQFQRARLTQAEEEALNRGGVSSADLAMGPTLWTDARRASEDKYRALLKSALTVTQAAKKMGVSDGRVRQLLKERRLYGEKVVGDWRLPAFQFLGKGHGQVPGIDKVLMRRPEDLGLLSLYRWFTTPSADLCVRGEGEQPLAPLDWLRSGHPPDVVATLAAEL